MSKIDAYLEFNDEKRLIRSEKIRLIFVNLFVSAFLSFLFYPYYILSKFLFGILLTSLFDINGGLGLVSFFIFAFIVLFIGSLLITVIFTPVFEPFSFSDYNFLKGIRLFIRSLTKTKKSIREWDSYVQFKKETQIEIIKFLENDLLEYLHKIKYCEGCAIPIEENANEDVIEFAEKFNKVLLSYKKLGSPYILGKAKEVYHIFLNSKTNSLPKIGLSETQNITNNIQNIDQIEKGLLDDSQEMEFIANSDVSPEKTTPLLPSKHSINNLSKKTSQNEEVLENVSKTNKEIKPSFIAQKVDWERLSALKSEIGKVGEEIVLELENDKLIELGRDELVFDLRHVSEVDGDGAGYDILSFDERGNHIYIEVKATTGQESNSLFFTSNELAFMNQKGMQFYLYRIYNLDIERRNFEFEIYKGKECILESFSFTPSTFLLKQKR